MIDAIFKYLAIVHVLLLITFVHALYGLQLKRKIHLYVFLILVAFVINESICTLGKIYLFSFKLSITIATALHSTFWLLIIKEIVRYPKIIWGLLLVFLTFSLCDLFFIEGWEVFNSYSFILGAFMYLILFLVESFYQLKQEHFSYFFSNNFILLMVPVLLFIGLTFMFGFKSREITTTLFFGKYQLYRIIIVVVNIVYYSLLNIYIYREKRKLYEF